MIQKVTTLPVVAILLLMVWSGMISSAESGVNKKSGAVNSVNKAAGTNLWGEKDLTSGLTLHAEQSVGNEFQGVGSSSFPATIIGSTYQDCQHFGSMGRQIVMSGSQASLVFSGYDLVNHEVPFICYDVISSTITMEIPDIEEGPPGSSFANVGVAQSRAVVAYNSPNGATTRCGIDFAACSATFTLFSFPSTNCGSIVTGTAEGPYVYPILATDMNGTQPIVHVVSTESPAVPGELRSLVYYRSTDGVSGSLGTCGQWIDAVDNISAVVAADPNSDNVAIAYLKAVDNSFTGELQNRNQQVWLVKSSALGATWGSPENISQYTYSSRERAYTDLDVLYTSDGCLHVVWNALDFDAGTGYASTRSAKLRHWSDCGCTSLIYYANYGEQGELCEAAHSCGDWNPNLAKMNLSECTAGANKRLYITYTRFLDGYNDFSDISANGYCNGEIFAQASTNGGESWGPPTNLTNTGSLYCTSGNCFSEHWSSSAPYVSDFLRILYIEDKDAGSAINSEGAYTNNPVKIIGVPCFDATNWCSIKVERASLGTPIMVGPSELVPCTVTLMNEGTIAANWSAVDHPDAITAIGLPQSGNLSAGCNSTFALNFLIQGPATEGYYSSFITINAASCDPEKEQEQAPITIPFSVYCFSSFVLPQYAQIQTTTNRLDVNQTSQVGGRHVNPTFTYDSDLSSYISDGYLIVGNHPLNLSYSTAANGEAPTYGNVFGHLQAASNNMVLDVTSSASFNKASGQGYNRDRTIGFDVDWYASKLPNFSEFFVGSFRVYKGPVNPTGSISGLNIGYFADWDIPSDVPLKNIAGADALRSAVWQAGTSTLPNTLRYGATTAYRGDGTSIVGGWVLDHPTYICPEGVWENDSLWNTMQTLSQGQYRVYSGTPENLHSGVLVYRNATINGANNDILRFVVVLAGSQDGPLSLTDKNEGLSSLTNTLDKAKQWICDHHSELGFDYTCCKCGDADNTGIITISDAVFLINYIFAGGPAPNPICGGDADGNNIITISDAVYLINYIFAGGPAPSGC